ncbi:MAG: DNA-dependent ATPase protein rad54 [Alyxoria varia]|nr:MAG: DNA-dependent ATPase protein rad54 [Alyxoria varia]
METYTGYVKTPADAVLLFEACRLGMLPRVQRRLSEKERQMIKSGSVFVWDEREAGMRRWTDGKSWSASRVNGSFLTYREMEGKRGGSSYSSNSGSNSRRNGSPANAGADNAEGDNSIEGPDGYRYKPDGLTKQSFSITTSQGQHLHLISYFSRNHSSTLTQPSQDVSLRNIRPEKGMYPESNLQDSHSTPAMTRSPMAGSHYSGSPQQHHSAASTPQYAQPRSHPHYMYGAYPLSPMSTPPTHNFSPYQNGTPSGHSPFYPGQSGYPPHHRPPPGPTSFDRAPPPMSSSGPPPPPPPPPGQMPNGYSSMPPTSVPPSGHPPYQQPYPPAPPRSSDYPPMPPPAPSQEHQNRAPSPATGNLDPRLTTGPPHPSSYSTAHPIPNPYRGSEPSYPSYSRPEESKPAPPTSSGGTIPSISSLINKSPSPEAQTTQRSSYGAGSSAQSTFNTSDNSRSYQEDSRQLRQLDKKAFPGRHRPAISTQSPQLDKENIPTCQRTSRLYGGTPQSSARLVRPFKCPGSATAPRTSDKPARKRRKVSYAVEGGDGEGDDGAYTNNDRLALATRDVNRFPVFKPKDKGSTFRQRFAVPLKDKQSEESQPSRPLGLRQGATFISKPLHDPCGEFAIVLYDPTVDDKPVDLGADEGQENQDGEKKEDEKTKLDAPVVHKTLADLLGLKKKVEDRKRVPVVIDPRLAQKLRPHQVEGVKFLYRCTTGLIDEKANGCIMADEMGLGKTLQCIALMWTLLRQSPDAGKSTITKCIVACPATLVRNWANEIERWLGSSIHPFLVDGKASKEELIQQLRQWCIASGRSVVRPVLIISYETLRMNCDELKNTPVGLLLCDEGHRLKNSDSQTFTALDKLNVQKRVILSGTPIQNDLMEYFSLLNFANPMLLGSRADFRKIYEIPILRGRDAGGTDADRQRGDEVLSQLLTLVNKFIIRRSNELLSKYLPVKYEHVVFCNLAPFQRALYKHFLKSPDIRSLLRGKGSQPLKAIGLLKKLCNHPDLLDLPTDLPGCEEFYPEDFVPKDARGRDRDVKSWYSGKMVVLDRMLAQIHESTTDKIVLISNYTTTLDVFASLCRSRGYGHLRLDGSMNVGKRQKLVDRFNATPAEEGGETVFLLSSKAGGCGINLIGANRLVLFDPDWNPAADQQALARVWRDGQKKDCFVYRFVATGSIEEKIFQRQSHKQSLSSCVVDSAEDVERHFSAESLRELFALKEGTWSDTHDTFKCSRCRAEDGRQMVKAQAMLYGDTSSWNHFVGRCKNGVVDGGGGNGQDEGVAATTASSTTDEGSKKKKKKNTSKKTSAEKTGDVAGASAVANDTSAATASTACTLTGLQDHLLKAEAQHGDVSAVFQYISH